MQATSLSVADTVPNAVNDLEKRVNQVGQTALELMVVLKDEERTYRHKFLIYEDVTMTPTDKIIQECIREARLSFKEMPDDIIIKTSMVVQ